MKWNKMEWKIYSHTHTHEHVSIGYIGIFAFKITITTSKKNTHRERERSSGSDHVLRIFKWELRNIYCIMNEEIRSLHLFDLTWLSRINKFVQFSREKKNLNHETPHLFIRFDWIGLGNATFQERDE